MNAVEYCLLHGLKVAGAGHPALLSAGETLTYGALAARVSQFAAGLRDAGVRPGDRVGMLMLDTPDIVAMHQAAMAAGGIAVAMSSRAAAEELQQILSIVRPTVLVVDEPFAEAAASALAAASPQTKLLRRDVELAAWKARPAAPLSPVPRAPGDPHQGRPAVRHLALPLRLCHRQHVRGAAHGCGQHLA
jgi:acyl-CoA synthetase (AMP-forming)/AMP-acid ligase II